MAHDAEPDHDGDDHVAAHGHAHGHEHDRGLSGMLRYLSHARSMWRSDVNEAVVARVAPVAGERVADIGAGVGAGTVLAAARGAHVAAIEPTSYMRRVLGLRRLWQRARSRIEVIDGAAEATGLDDDAVDAIWAVNSMHHWTDPAAAHGELARILRPGGRLLLVDEDFDHPAHPRHEEFRERHSDHHHYFDTVDPTAIGAALAAVGLEVSAAGTQDIAGAPALVVEATAPARTTRGDTTT